MSYANRGMAFEQLIDVSNEMYDHKGIAIINKRPTPVKIQKQISGSKIIGFIEKQSTVDYDGTYLGRSIVFEAKSTKETNRFDLKNIHDHQIEYLAKCHEAGAISFLLIEFAKNQIVYLMTYETMSHYWERMKKGGRGTKSIQIEDFQVHGYEVHTGRVPVDYIAVVNQVWKLGVA